MEGSSSLALEQLQQDLVQQVAELYCTHLGHQLLNISCRIADKTVTILAEDSVTPLEEFLGKNQQLDLAKQVRNNLLKALEPHFQVLIEKVIGVPVVDVICNSTFETGRTSIVALLSAVPDIPGLESGQRTKQLSPKSDTNLDGNK